MRALTLLEPWATLVALDGDGAAQLREGGNVKKKLKSAIVYTVMVGDEFLTEDGDTATWPYLHYYGKRADAEASKRECDDDLRPKVVRLRITELPR